MVERRELYNRFLSTFPLETLNQMTLAQYTDLKRDNSFCYWLESKTNALGSIWGGSSFKFGIYEYQNKPDVKESLITSDEKYAWYTKYNATDANAAFMKVKNAIYKIAVCARKGDFKTIEDITELGDVYKWKIAFLYSNEKLIPIYKQSMLISLANHFGMTDLKQASYSTLQDFLLKQKGDKDIFSFYDELLDILNQHKTAPRYWIYTPGKDASKWDWCQEEEAMSIGWDYMGDLSEYATKKTITENIRKIHKKPDDSFKNISLALWEFSHEIQIGDIVYAKKGLTKIIGRGIVESEYQFDDSISSHKNVRKVKWTHIGEWDSPEQNVQKTLTDITKYPAYCEKLEAIFNPESSINKEEYGKEDFLNEVYMSAEEYARLESLLLAKKNIILQGAPGVGKTYSAKRLAYAVLGKKDNSKVEIIQFHQNYSYEDFLMGYRPTENGSFELKKGIFYAFCKKAENDPENSYFFIIDEINRGNMSKVFGELLMLIEKDYRGEEHQIRLAYNDEKFFVPTNLYLIGMMNTADRSLAMIDYALRRRFSFFEMTPAFDSAGFKKYQANLNNDFFNQTIEIIKQINREIEKDDSLGKGFCIGHSYFCNQNSCDPTWLHNVIEYDIDPMLREYWFDDDSMYQENRDKLLNLIR